MRQEERTKLLSIARRIAQTLKAHEGKRRYYKKAQEICDTFYEIAKEELKLY
jgi:hypothetical protein